MASVEEMSKTFEQHLLRQPLDDDDGDEFEHGDAIANSRHVDPSDYSVHQFLAADDARGVKGSDEETASGGEDDDDGAADEVERSQAEAQEDDFGSQDTPEDSFLQQTRAQKQPIIAHQSAFVQRGAMDMKSLVKMSKAFEQHLLRQPMDDDDGDEFEH